jgi:hypothetical protein
VFGLVAVSDQPPDRGEGAYHALLSVGCSNAIKDCRAPWRVLAAADAAPIL